MGETEIALHLRLFMGRQWLKLVKKALGDFSSGLIAKISCRGAQSEKRQGRGSLRASRGLERLRRGSGPADGRIPTLREP